MARNETGSRGKMWTRRSAAKLIAGAASAAFAPRLSYAADKTVYLLTWGRHDPSHARARRLVQEIRGSDGL